MSSTICLPSCMWLIQTQEFLFALRAKRGSLLRVMVIIRLGLSRSWRKAGRDGDSDGGGGRDSDGCGIRNIAVSVSVRFCAGPNRDGSGDCERRYLFVRLLIPLTRVSREAIRARMETATRRSASRRLSSAATLRCATSARCDTALRA